MLPTSVRCVRLKNKIWSSALDVENGALFFELRSKHPKQIQLVKLKLETLQMDEKVVEIPWWSNLMLAQNDQLYFVEYPEANDPSKQSFFQLDFSTENRKSIRDLPKGDSLAVMYPQLYESGSAYFQTVASFLSLDLPLSCEYLEWNDKIIISYYLRSDDGFDRYLLVLRGGEKVWKIRQDVGMKGFSPGAFFVFKSQLIFIKDQNEVCIYGG